MKHPSIKINKSLTGAILLALALVAMLLLAGSLDVKAGVLVPPQVLAVYPESNTHTAEVSTSISITYDQNMDPDTVNPNTFVVHARQTGKLLDMPEVEGGMITVEPDGPLHAGELVQVSATTSTLNMEGEGPLNPTVWEFTAAPWGGNAYFHNVAYRLSEYNRYAAMGDLDGDGDLDMITSSCDGIIDVMENDGSGSFSRIQQFDLPSCISDVTLGDLDGDGDLDAFLVSLDSVFPNRILLNNGGMFTLDIQELFSNTDTYAELGDLDGDGDLDIFVVSGGFELGTIRTWENDGTGVFSLMDDFDDSYQHTGLAMGDLDGDFDLDVFTAGWNYQSNKVWLNDGTGEFTEAQTIPLANSYWILLGDLDGDGDLDAYFSNLTSALTDLPDEVWINDGTGLFTNSGQILDTPFSMIPALGDLDADGDLDVYLSEWEFAPDEVWINDGNGNFNKGHSTNESDDGALAWLGDLDNDGNLDVVTGDLVENYLVLMNGDWTQAEPLPEPLAANLVQCPNDTGSFYMVGGVDAWGNSSNRLYKYNIAAAEWEQLASMPAVRRAVAAACYHDKIYVAGGLGYDIYRTLYIYNILSNTWSAGPILPDIIWGAAMGAWDGKLFVVGGTRIDYPYTPTDRVDVYDLVTQEWTAGGGTPMPTAASFFGSVQTGPYLYAIGGGSGDPMHNIDQTQRYNMATNKWEIGPQFTSARSLVSLSASSSHLFALGGDMDGGGVFDITDLVEVLDLSTWPEGTWTVFDDPLPQPNIYPASTCSEVLTGGEIWAVGGGDENLDPYDTNYYYPIDEPCVSYGAGLPEPWTARAEPGTTVEYTFNLTNTGVVTDYYTLEVNTTWDIAAPLGGPGPIGPGESMQIAIAVEVPDGMWNDFGVTEITATSLSNPSAHDTTSITTYIKGYQVEVSPVSPDTLSDHPGQVLTYTLQVDNIGDYADSYTVTVSTAWAIVTPISVGPLLPGEADEMFVTVEIPADALHEAWDVAEITLTSQSDPRVSTQVSLTSTAFWHRMLIPVAMKN